MRKHMRMVLAAALVLTTGCALERGIAPMPVVRLYVLPNTVTCQGVFGPLECMQVKASLDGPIALNAYGIEGFTHDPAYFSELLVEVIKLSDPPMDGPDTIYKLHRIVKRTPVIID